MARILILGAGVMGTALAVPASDNGHYIFLAGTPLDDAAIASMKAGAPHPKLDAPLAETVTILAADEVMPHHAANADLIIVGVSSEGVSWAAEKLNALLNVKKTVAFVTKGLCHEGEEISTYAEILPPRISNMAHFIGIGGPCIARELGSRTPTLSLYASHNHAAAAFAVRLMQTPYYRLAVGHDVSGVEACAALKNFYTIGVSAMQTRYPNLSRTDNQSKNPIAGAFNQAVQEMAFLCEKLGGQRETAFDLAGLGDLHVTVGGGRNSKLGSGLGKGDTVSQVMAGDLAGETVEGIATARIVAALLEKIGDDARKLPLAHAIVEAVINDREFNFDFSKLF